MKKRMRKFFVLLLFTVLAVGLARPVSADDSVKMPKKLYKVVKGKWYSEISSGGCNVKFTRTKVKYYSRKSNKLVSSVKLVKVKKYKKGQYKGCYRLIYKCSSGKFSYINSTRKAKVFDYYGSAKGYKHYSGSGSLERGKR